MGCLHSVEKRPVTPTLHGPLVDRTGAEISDGEKFVLAKVKCLYFAANNSEGNEETNDVLCFYNTQRAANKTFEFVYVSQDPDESSFKAHLALMSWPAVPFEDVKRRAALTQMLNIHKFPKLVILDEEDVVVTRDGLRLADIDPNGFPYRLLRGWH